MEKKKILHEDMMNHDRYKGFPTDNPLRFRTSVFITLMAKFCIQLDGEFESLLSKSKKDKLTAFQEEKRKTERREREEGKDIATSQF